MTIKDLPIYKGRAYRAESNLLCHGNTVLDIIEFEENELLNKDYKHLDSHIRKELSKISYDRAIWICKKLKDAKEYGENAREIYIGKNVKILAFDGGTGYLILTN